MLHRKKIAVRLREDVFDVLAERAEEGGLTLEECASDLLEEALEDEVED